MITRVTYNKNNYVTSTITTNHKGKVTDSYIAVVNEKGMVLSSTYQHKKGLRMRRGSYVLTYDTEGKVIRSATIENDKAREYVNAYSKF
jgi:hypothetical protein